MDDEKCYCRQDPEFDNQLKGYANRIMDNVMKMVEDRGLCTDGLLELYANVLLLMVNGIQEDGTRIPAEVTLMSLTDRCRAKFATFEQTTYLSDIVNIRGGGRRDQ